MTMARSRLLLLLLPLLSPPRALLASRPAALPARRPPALLRAPRSPRARPACASDGDSNNPSPLRDSLRAEAESPYRKPRLFLYVAAAGSAGIGLVVTLSQLAAAAGAGAELGPLVRNVAIDALALGGALALVRADLAAGARRIERLSAGRQLAALRVRMQRADDSSVRQLAELRARRGRDARVVLVAGAGARVQAAVDGCLAPGVAEEMAAQEMLLVPVVFDGAALGAPPERAEGVAHIALPAPGSEAEWRRYLAEEEAPRAAGIDLSADALCVVLKKNGRVGQRALVNTPEGVPWRALLADVQRRRAAGMDVMNI